MKNILKNFPDSWEREQQRLILWVPACMALGIAWYFSLSAEPVWWLGAACTFTGIILCLLTGKSMLWRCVCIALTLVALGVALSQYRTFSVRAPFLQTQMNYAQVTGTVEEILPTPKGAKILLKSVVIEKLPPEKTPLRVSITLKHYDPNLLTGERISLHAGLFPPPEPSLPGGFDFGQYFYFQQIGAVGYGISEIQIIAPASGEDFDVKFSDFRHRLTESIRSYFHEPAGAVAAAFITGETRAIPNEVNNDMRIAGLYHLLAVSGMNLSVVAGIAFFSFRLLLATIPTIALRFPIKKWAALAALIASYIYLRVSGSPVSAERAFFMVSLVFIAILIDRDPAPMRSVAIAAFCIMLYEPEAALTASFQLSFSATAALIASYEWGVGSIGKGNREFGLARVFWYFAAIIAASLVAWLATEPFIIYHFNQFSSYSLLSNTVAEPLVSFFLMPLVIAGVLLLPFGLAGLAFKPMQYGVDWLLGIAHYVAHLPHAMWMVPNPTDAGFMFVIYGALWIYFWRTRWRWFGLIGVAIGMISAFAYTPPDIFIGSDGKHIAALRDDGQIVMIKGGGRNFTAQQWEHAALDQEYADADSIPKTCDDQGCIVTIKGKRVALINNENALMDDCTLADIIIINRPASGSNCKAQVIDKTELEARGNAAVWIGATDIKVRYVRDVRGNRPWMIRSNTEYP